jgi:hypothetical protein
MRNLRRLVVQFPQITRARIGMMRALNHGKPNPATTGAAAQALQSLQDCAMTKRP